jgi:hypothetical protein
MAACVAGLAGAMTLLFGTAGRRPFPGRGRAGPCGRYGGQGGCRAAEALRQAGRQRRPEGEGALGAAQRGVAGAMTTRAAGRLVAVACFMAATGATGAHSETDTNSANVIMPACEGFLAHKEHNLLSAYRQGICAGEVQGVWATASALGRVCPPQATVGQAVLVVMRFINARPDRMHEPFSFPRARTP